MIHAHSLHGMLDAVGEAFFAGRQPAEAERREICAWLVRRQKRSGPQAGMFAPTDAEYRAGVALFTGEALKTRLGARHVLSAEAARILALCGPPTAEAAEARDRAEQWLLAQCFARMCRMGECAHSAVALMRYLALSPSPDAQDRLAAQVWVLSHYRQGQGRWKGFPFYYTLLALGESPPSLAAEELRYAAPACERARRRLSGDDHVAGRRRLILERALARA